MAKAQRKNYLALGDSYTIGESVQKEGRWTSQLVGMLQDHKIDIQLEETIAVTGWTTDELIAGINEKKDSLLDSYDLVSLLIGVNNQYRGYSIKQYEAEFEELLKNAIELAGKKASNVFVVSIPDYGITPFAEKENKPSEKIFIEINQYNQIAASICAAYGVLYLDINPISQKTLLDSENLVANDDLHPSAKMYQLWAEYCFPSVYRKFLTN